MFQTYLYMGKVPLRFSGSPPQTPMSKGGGSLLGDRAWKPLLMAPSSCKHAFDWLSCVVQPCEKPSTRHRRNTTIRQTIVGTRAMKAPGAMCNCTLQTLINDTWHKQLASPCGLPINISPKAYQNAMAMGASKFHQNHTEVPTKAQWTCELQSPSTRLRSNGPWLFIQIPKLQQSHTNSL